MSPHSRDAVGFLGIPVALLGKPEQVKCDPDVPKSLSLLVTISLTPKLVTPASILYL